MKMYINKHHLKNILIILLQFHILYGNTQETDHNEHEFYTVSPFSELFASRIYTIARIKELMTFLQKSYVNKILDNIEDHINEELFYEWKQFSQFQKLNDPDFQINFIKKIFKILYLILETNKAFYTQFKLHITVDSQHENKTDETMHYFHAIDTMFDFIKIRILPSMKKKIDLEHNMSEQVIGVDSFTHHFYKIRRIARAKKILQKSHASFNSKEQIYFKNPLHELSNFITHDAIKQTIQKMIKAKKITPLFNLWHDFEQFKYTNDTRFFQEMLMTIFATYKKVLMKTILDADQEKNISQELEIILALYENIEQLNEEELLLSIDRTTDYLKEILEAMETKPTLFSKLKKWFLPTGALAGIIFYFMMRPT